MSADVRRALADHWRDQGELEHASVVAFQDLARRLAMVDAPDELVRRALRAVEQESDHWVRCFDLAGRYLGQSLRPGRLRRPLRLPRSRPHEIAALAVESLCDGMLNEGYAAVLADARARRATDARVHETMRIIARDEAEHAAFAADVFRWCVASGGAFTRSSAADALALLPTRLHTAVIPHGLPDRPLADHGCFDADPHGELYDLLRRTVIAEADRALQISDVDAAA